MKNFLLICVVAVFSAMIFSCSKTHLPPTTEVDSLKVGLIAYYPFNNTAADMSGNNFNGVAHNVTPTTDRFGTANGAYYFEGDTSSYVTVVDHPELRLSNTDFTINVWINLAAYNTSIGSHIISARTNVANSGYTYSVDGYGESGYPLGVQGFGVGGGGANAVSNSGLALNSWHMLTVTFSPKDSTLTFYKDAVFDGATKHITTPNNSAAPIYFGKDTPLQPTSYYLTGSLNDIRIYGRKLPLSQINQLYALTN